MLLTLRIWAGHAGIYILPVILLGPVFTFLSSITFLFRLMGGVMVFYWPITVYAYRAVHAEEFKARQEATVVAVYFGALATIVAWAATTGTV